jgi:23S rRNA-/tRNA-specific pseudouridylate synthase
MVQNCLEGVRSCLGISQAYLPQRLDIDTSGLMIVCTSKDFLIQVNRTIASRGVIKRYRALLASDKECSVEAKRQLLNGAIWEAHLMKTKTSPKVLSLKYSSNLFIIIF